MLYKFNLNNYFDETSYYDCDNYEWQKAHREEVEELCEKLSKEPDVINYMNEHVCDDQLQCRDDFYSFIDDFCDQHDYCLKDGGSVGSDFVFSYCHIDSYEPDDDL